MAVGKRLINGRKVVGCQPQKVGRFIEIPERRFVGDAPEVRKTVEDVLAEVLEEWLTGKFRRNELKMGLDRLGKLGGLEKKLMVKI